MSLDLAGLAPAPIDLGVLPSELDEGIASRAAIGVVVLATDQTMEHEFRALLRLPGVAIYQSRVFNDAEIRPDTLRAIGPRIAPSVALILPGIPLDVVAFGCTSATMTLGEEAVFAEIRKERPSVACTTPVTATLAAFRALGASSIGLLTPYAPEINASLVAYLRSRGVDVAAVATFDRRDDRDAARISVASIEAGIWRLAAAPGVETIFVSCTSLRAAEFRRQARAPRRRFRHLQQSRDGVALPAPRGRKRHPCPPRENCSNCRRREKAPTVRPLRISIPPLTSVTKSDFDGARVLMDCKWPTILFHPHLLRRWKHL